MARLPYQLLGLPVLHLMHGAVMVLHESLPTRQSFGVAPEGKATTLLKRHLEALLVVKGPYQS